MTTPDSGELLPITGSQQGLLVVHDRNTGAPVYNQLVRFDLDPAYDHVAVEAAVTAMVTMQPAMRLVFGVLPRMHARFTEPPSTVRVEQVLVPAAEFEDAVASTARRIGPPRFDLQAGPAYRFAAVRAADGSASALLLADHHIIIDGLSIGPMVADLERMLADPLDAEQIAAKTAARESAYRKEVQAQERSAGSAEVAERSRAWAERLRAVPPLELVPLPGRPTQTAFRGGRLRWHLSPAESTAVQTLCQELDVTPFTLFNGVYGALLARYGNVSEVLVGCPFMARRTVRAFDVAGFFVNTLPVLVSVDWSTTVAEHLAAVGAEVAHCQANIDVPFTRLVADVAPERSGNRNPLFAAMLAMQDTFTARPDGAVRGIGEPANDTAKFDLWLGATPVDGRWLLELEYDRELIGPAIADGMMTALRTALRRTLAAPSRPLADLCADASAAVSRRHDGWSPRLPEQTLLGCVEAAAKTAPESVAIETDRAELTYGELVASAARVSGGLADRGVGRRDVVGLATTDLATTVTAILAIARRGATFLPLDASLPAERLAYMAAKARCRLVVGRDLLDGVPAVDLAELDRAEPAESAEDLDAPLYVMFTSGSTGVPKGVLMGHRRLLELAAWQVDVMAMDADSRFLQYAPLGFDVSFQEILPTLAAGGTVVSREPADRRDFAAVLRRIADSAVTHVYLPVAALRPVVQLAEDRGLRLPALRFLCVSGEQLLLDERIRGFFVRHPHSVLINHYGPTETQAVTTYLRRGSDTDWPAHAPIGTPLPGVRAYVVDASGHLAPPGVPGELYLGGNCPADGYVDDRPLTATRFLPDAFDPAGGTVYRTGDQVLRADDGELVFLGRRDTQVKIRGNRVELGEIEVVANRLAGVRQAVAVVRGGGADAELALLLHAEDGAEVDPGLVRAQLTATLPGYMCPLWIVAVDSVPATPTGKTDRAALLRTLDGLLADQQRQGPAAPVAYADDLERELAETWSRVLGVDGIHADRSLLEYGAHSLNIFTTLAEIQQAHGVGVALAEFFSSPTITTMASLLRAAKAGA